MRSSLALALPFRRLRAAAVPAPRLVAGSADFLHRHALTIRLFVLVTLAFLLAFYLDTREASAHEAGASHAPALETVAATATH